jgi:hypothetical protein
MVCSQIKKARFSRLAALSTLRGLVMFALLAGFVQEAAAANTYRYKDDSGRQIYGSTVPPQFVRNGYEILNERGVVIQVVPRALTPAELAAQEAQRAEQEAADAAAQEQQRADNLLLRLYRSPDEIARKRDESVTIIEGQITALVASLAKVEAEVKRLEGLMASQSANGGTPAALTVETLRIQTEERDRLLTLRTRLDTDRSSAMAEADRDMKRLAELMGLPPPTEQPAEEEPAATEEEPSATEKEPLAEESATD